MEEESANCDTRRWLIMLSSSILGPSPTPQSRALETTSEIKGSKAKDDHHPHPHPAPLSLQPTEQ